MARDHQDTHELGSSFVGVLVPAMAVREPERYNPSVPVVRRAGREIIRARVPKRAVIHWIDRHLAVVSGPDVVQLEATAVDQRFLAERQCAQG